MLGWVFVVWTITFTFRRKHCSGRVLPSVASWRMSTIALLTVVLPSPTPGIIRAFIFMAQKVQRWFPLLVHLHRICQLALLTLSATKQARLRTKSAVWLKYGETTLLMSWFGMNGPKDKRSRPDHSSSMLLNKTIGCLRFSKLCWVGKHINIIMKPMKFPNPRPAQPKKN